MTKRNADIRVQIYESEYKAIMAEARRLAEIETGGDLYGTFTHGSNPIIWLASGPGPKVRHELTHFEQDTAFTTYWERRLTNAFGLQYIGSWHSHHFLGLQEPSSGDVGAAQLYARQHNRQTTLEIIVNHRHARTKRGEEQFNTILSPYFYPDAQNAKMERFVLASFVPLAGVSPIRQQLADNELKAFNRIGWQQASEFQLPSAPLSQTIQSSVATDDDAVIIPDMLGVELQSIADEIQDFNIQQNSKAFLITITPIDGFILALVVQKPPELRIMQVNLIDRTRDINENITTKLHDEMGFHFSINQRNRGVLLNLVRLSPSIHRNIVFDQEQRRSGPLPGKPEQPEIKEPSSKELREMQKQLQEQRTLAQQLEGQWENAQHELETLRIEARTQSTSREIEIERLKAQLVTAQRSLADKQDNERSLAELREVSTAQQRQLSEQLASLQKEVQIRENELLEAQKGLAHQRLIEEQLEDSRQQIETEHQKAVELESRLADLQTQLTMHKQMESRLKDTQERLDVQQDQVGKLEKELDEAKKKLEVAKADADKSRRHWYSIRNRAGPAGKPEENKDRGVFTNLSVLIILLIIATVIVAMLFLFILSHRSR